MYRGGASGIPSGVVGFTLRITFSSTFSGRSFTVNGGGQNIQSTVPSGLYVEITVQNLSTTYTITCNGVSLRVYVPEYYGYKNVIFTSGGNVLNNNTWSEIRAISDAGQGANYWSVGDYKNIRLSGTAGIQNVSGTYRAFILGFNHNASTEGNNRIHFMIGRNSSGRNIAFCDSQYNKSGSSTAFRMNTSNTNAGGWANSYMRSTILGATSTSATSSRFMAVIPSDLRSVLKSCVKYTDNTGNNSNTSSAVTATTDYMWLCSEFEVSGKISHANQHEQDRQEQYAYFAAGNTRVKYGAGAQSSSTTVAWWLRSPSYDPSGYFCLVDINGTTSHNYASYGQGVAPCFCV